MKWGRMETEQLSSHIWQAAYQEALCAWSRTAPAAYSARLLSLGCTLSVPMSFIFHGSDQTTEPDLPQACWQAAWTQALLLTYHGSSKQPTAHGGKRRDKWALTGCSTSWNSSPALQEVQGRNTYSVDGLHINWVKPSVCQPLSWSIHGLCLCYIKRIRNCSLRNWCCTWIATTCLPLWQPVSAWVTKH